MFEPTSLLLAVLTVALLSAAIGAAAGYFFARARGSAATAATTAGLEERVLAREATITQLTGTVTALEQKVASAQAEQLSLHAKLSELTEKLRSSEEEQVLLQKVQVQFTETFKLLSADALRNNNQAFLEVAQSSLSKFHEASKAELENRQLAINELVKPVKESLDKFEVKVQEIEKARIGAYEGLTQQVRSLLDTQVQLRAETGNLVKALGTPRIRGYWGEIQLRRVVELAGMLEHCDFSEQQSVTTEDGRLRPDLIVRLPAGKTIVVDAKAPLAGYLEAMNASDEPTRRARLKDHARHLQDHAIQLGKKSYWEKFAPAPEFVILFIPGEALFTAALEQVPELIEQAVAERVLFATPTTLIALLKAVSYGWRQETLAQNAEEISILGKDLYKRIGGISANFESVGNALSKAVISYNSAVHNLENKVLVTARKFKDLKTTGIADEIEVLDVIDERPRTVQAPELLAEKISGA